MSDPDSLTWMEHPARDVGEAVVASMTAGGIDHLFFTSGSDIVFYQEAVAKQQAEHGGEAIRFITVPHENASLNAALGYATVSGKPVATAAHVDVGTLHYGAAIHTAWQSGLPVLITAGAPPTAYPGSMRGGRDEGGHLWSQQTFDQNGIIRQYTKWDHRLEYQDNPGLIVSRALQVALTEPRGPVYLSFPREISQLPLNGTSFPTAAQLGIPRQATPDPDGIAELAARLIAARNPVLIVSESGRDPASVPALVALCETLGLPVVDSVSFTHLSFPMTHPLYQQGIKLADADLVLALESSIPWMPARNEPARDAYIAVIGTDPIKGRIPTYEFTANLRLTADPLRAILALSEAVKPLLTESVRARIGERTARWTAVSARRQQAAEAAAVAVAANTPIDPFWASYQISQMLGDNCILLDEVTPRNGLLRYLRLQRPGSHLFNPGSGGGWAPGAALGAKLAAPDRDVIAVTGDGFYMFGAANAALWAGAHHGAPFMVVVYQNRSYSTGTVRLAEAYPDGYAARAGYAGGYIDPPIDFAMEAQAAGAYGETVYDPAEVGPALRRGLEQVRGGKCAVISIWMARLLASD